MRYTQLALTLIDGVRAGAPAAARAGAEAAQRDLSTFIADAARRVHGRYNYLRPQPAADFVNEAPGHMTAVLIERYPAFHAGLADDNRSDDPAAGFLYTAVANHYVTVARRRTAVQLTASADHDGDGASPFDRMADDNRRPAGTDAVAAIDVDDFWSSPLPDADWRVIQGWRPIDAAVLLLLSGLHVKLTADQWRSVLAGCGRAGPVPSATTSALSDAKRRDGLAADLGLTRNGMDQTWSRKRGWLAELQFVDRVRRDHAGRDAA